MSVSLPFHPLPLTYLSACLYILFLNLSVTLPFHPLLEPVCQLAFSSSSQTCLSACLFILFPNLSVSLPFRPLPESVFVSLPLHPFPEPVCQLAFSSSSWTCLSACLFILFLNHVCKLAFSSFSRACLFSLVHKPVCQHAKIYSSIAFKRKQKMISENRDFFLMQQRGFFYFKRKLWSKVMRNFFFRLEARKRAIFFSLKQRKFIFCFA